MIYLMRYAEYKLHICAVIGGKVKHTHVNELGLAMSTVRFHLS
ncbi:hypothetical protein ACVWY0_002442 [Arthrobacter sp. UYNi723]